MLISKWGILSIEMQKAVKYDQGVIKDEEVEYVDNDTCAWEESEEIQAKQIKEGKPEKEEKIKKNDKS